jgi:uncharacterized phiE125 gp8 family phage protein
MKTAAWTQVTGPVSEPLSLEEMKEHLRVDAADEDALLSEYITAARGAAELYTGRAFVTQTWQAHFAGWPADGVLELPLPPLQSVAWVKYTTEAGVLTTLSASVYRVVTACEPGCILLAPNQSWPSVTLDAGLPVVVQFVCGYGAAAAVPAGLKQAMRWLAGHMTENREAVTMATSTPQQVPMSARWAMDPHRFRYNW